MKKKLAVTLLAFSALCAALTLAACGEKGPTGDGGEPGGDAGHVHELTYVAAVEATCTEPGSLEYWACSDCGKNFADENASEEISDITVPAKGHHYENGYCVDCGEKELIPSEGLEFALSGNAYEVIGIGTCSDTDVVIPSVYNGLPVTSIGAQAFSGTAYYNNERNWEDGVLYIGKYLIEVNEDFSGGDYTVKEGTTLIADSAFYGCDSLTSVTIPDSVTSIGERAFYYCSSLTSVTIPDSVTSIGDSAFGWCNGLTEIVIPDSVTSIGTWAFRYCGKLTSIVIPNSVTSIGWGVFSDCYSLTSITIPDGVTSIGMSAFSHCDSLTTVYYAGTEEQWNEISIGEYNEELTEVKILFKGEW